VNRLDFAARRQTRLPDPKALGRASRARTASRLSEDLRTVLSVRWGTNPCRSALLADTANGTLVEGLPMHGSSLCNSVSAQETYRLRALTTSVVNSWNDPRASRSSLYGKRSNHVTISKPQAAISSKT
jgi:hypothetical protein